MNNNGFLIPANSKKGTLILNIFRLADIIIFGSGIIVSVIALSLLGDNVTLILILLACMPALVTGFLVIPIPYYHNMLVVLQCIYEFLTERQKYEWKGWCFYGEYEETKEEK